MNPQKHNMAVLGQIVKLIPRKIIESLRKKHKIQTRSFTATSHVVAMIYSQLTHALSLNDVCDGMKNHHGILSQIRDCVPPSRNGLAHANKNRPAAMAEELFWIVYNELKTHDPEFFQSSRNYPGLPRRFKRAIHIVDSSTIPLIAKCMDWAKHRSQKAAAKLHMDLLLGAFLPGFAVVNRAKDSDPKMAWEVCANIKAGEIVVFDKAYCDFKHLATLNERGVFWVTRAKDNIKYEIMGQQPVKKSSLQAEVSSNKAKVMGQQPVIIADYSIALTCPGTVKHYSGKLRMVIADIWVDNKLKRMAFLSNNMTWAASSICELYKSRWAIEVFFKEIKQTLQLADFMGTSENAVKWQIWTALLTYLLLRFIAWKHQWKHSFHRLFTLIRAILWNFLNLETVLKACEKVKNKSNKPPPPVPKQMEFYF